MANDEQKRYIVEILNELETQINPGEYYSYDPRDFVENVKEAEKLFGINYEFNERKWIKDGDNIVHKGDKYFRRY